MKKLNERATVSLLRCVECPDRPRLSDIRVGDRLVLRCPRQHEFEVTGGVARMLRAPLRESLARATAVDAVTESKRRTAASFGYEWTHFATLRPQWEKNFLDYMSPHGKDFFRDKLVLDAGSGMGRHAFHAAANGAAVVAVDLGDAIEVTQRNTRDLDVLPVQADLYDLPFADGTFDFVYSLGVLHHLPDPGVALRELTRVCRSGGEVHIYVYWRHERGIRNALLQLVTAARRVTTRLPHALMRALAYPIAAVAYALFVVPARVLGAFPPARELARSLPLAGYADYPFMVCVNDQFDRFSAPLEHRYSAGELKAWLTREGLRDIHLSANYGWVAGGTKPGVAPAGTSDRAT